MQTRSMIILGARSFLGSVLADAITNQWLDEGFQVDRLLVTGKPERVKRHDSNSITEAVIDYNRFIQMKLSRFDLAIQAASPTAITQMASPEYRTSLWRLNVELTDKLITSAQNASEKSNHRPLVVYFSSREVYAGLQGLDVADEEQVVTTGTLNARSIYRTAKLLGENLLSAAAQDGILQAHRLRIAHVYGPGMRFGDGRVLGDLFDDAFNHRTVRFFGDGKHLLQPMHIQDFVGAVRSVLDSGVESSVWNVAHPTPIDVRSVAKILGMAASKEVESIPRENHDRPYLREAVPLLSVKKLMDVGWKPAMDHEAGFMAQFGIGPARDVLR